MWLVTGPFDTDESVLANARTTKLLRTSKEYTFGRKDADLVVGSKRISARHGTFHVGEFDPENPTAVPALTLETTKKSFIIERGDQKMDCEPVIAHELRDDDKLVILNVQLRVEWRRICCYSTELNDLLPQCKSLGINLVCQPSPEVTHHFTQALAPTASLAASLISSAQFVKPEWLKDVVALGDDAHRQLALARYAPQIDANLDPKIWQPNEERLHIFRNYRFLYLVERQGEVPLDVRRMIETGDGSLEKRDVHAGVNGLLEGIRRGNNKEGKKLVLVADPALLEAALEKDVLEEFKDVAKSYGLSFHSPDTLIKSVLDVDTSKLDPATVATPPAPEETPPVVEAPRRPMRRRVPSREPSAPSPAPEPAPPAPLPTIMRMKRRRNPVEDMITGLDDPSSILDAPPDLSLFSVPRAPTSTILQAPTPGKPMRRRNRQTSVEPNNLGSVPETFEVPDTFKEPPLKRFKALFEASDPSRLGSIGSAANIDSQFNESGFNGGGSSIANGQSVGTMSQTQMESQSGMTNDSKGKSVQSLSALREEEEEEETGPSALDLGTTSTSKRKRAGEGADGDGDAVMSDAESHPPPKRRATGDAQAPASGNGAANGQVAATAKTTAAVESSSKSKSKTKAKGAAVGDPDKDSAFLKAVASTKRGKKNEDEFDREFNNLRIAKPKLNESQDEPEKWAVLAEFGDDSGLRGNFMTIVEMEIFKEQNPNGRTAYTSSNSGLKPEWEGKPNFKKFKKKVTRSERPKIDLVAVNEDESSLPASYWKEPTQSRSQPKAAARRGASAARSPPPPSDDDAEEVPASAPNKRKQSQASIRSTSRSRAGSRAGSVEPPPPRRAASRKLPTISVIEEDDEDDEAVQVSQKSRRSRSSSQKSSALFLPADDDDEEEDEGHEAGSFAMDDDDFETSTLQSKEEESFPKRTAARRAPVRKPSKPVREDSDDEGVFTGF